MATLWQDIKYGIRMLARNPGFAIVVVLILGLGIGATTAVFSVVNGVLLRPLPYKDPGRVVMVFSTKSSQRRPASRLTFQDWQSQSKSFEDMAVSSFTAKTCRHEEGTDRIEGMRVSSSLFGLLGLEPLVGRTFLPEETWPDHQYVILGYDFWKRRFGCDESALGSSIMLGPDITLAPKDELHTVIGVMPPGIGFLNTRNPFLRPSGTNTRVDFWVPVNEEMPDHRGSNVNWDVVGRLKRGVTIEMAQAEMDAIASRVAREHYADPAKAPGVEVVSLHEYIVGRTRRPILLAAGAAAFVMLIACANVANLLLVRSLGRRREIALRATLGAARLRLVRQVVTEGMLLAALGGLLGLLLAFWGADAFRAIAPETVPRQGQVAIGSNTLVFTVTGVLLTGTILGLLPAVRMRGLGLSEALKQGDAGITMGSGRRRLASVLVGGQLSLSLTLLVGSGLLINSLSRLLLLDPGYRTQNILTMKIRHARDDSCYAILRRAEVLPGVRAAALVSGLPLSGDLAPSGNVTPPDEVRADIGRPMVKGRIVTPGYFGLMGIPFLSGRDFTERDAKDAASVVIVNESLARLFWPQGDPIGKRFKVSWAGDMVEVAGVVRDTRSAALDAAPDLEAYFPARQETGSFVFRALGFRLLVATESHPKGLIAPLRKAVSSVNRDAVICETQTMREIVDKTLAVRRFLTIVLSVFALAAVTLAGFGIYGVIAHCVKQRTHEIAIRMALGARTSNVLQSVMRQGARLVLAGIAIGLAGALALTRVLASLLYDISPMDPLTFVCVSLLLAGVALLACYLPARRAARIDPMQALRYE